MSDISITAIKEPEHCGEGRFKSCLVEDDVYLLHPYRYIELNPVRALMVVEPSEYTWSSYQVNALGKVSNLCSPHLCTLR